MSQRRLVVVVSDPSDAAGLPQNHVVTADRYLEGSDQLTDRELTVVNLCRSYRYRTKGYYVSLLADARGQQVIPTIETIEGLSEPFGLFRALQEAGVPTVDGPEMRSRRRGLPATITPEDDGGRAARGTKATPLLRVANGNGPSYRPASNTEVAETVAYFGSSDDRRFAATARAVYREWPTPVLCLRFLLEEEDWKVTQVTPIPLHQLSRKERGRLAKLLENESLVLRRGTPAPREETRAAIAVLMDQGDPFSPSSPETIDHLEQVASRLNVHVRRVGLEEIGKLGEYDGLFIRALTGVREPAFQWALRAEALGMPVVDDTQSIIRCSNKVFLEELLRREGIPTPRTLVVTSKTPWEQICSLGDPFVIKLPDSSFSAAVHKVSSQAEYRKHAAEMFRRSPLIIAQEYLPTEYDWRITVLGGKLLFAARYYMASGHWQIRTAEGGGEIYGQVEAVPRGRAPAAVVELGLRAASLIGNGLYGVDIKETPRGPVVIEINDNPNLDLGEEDTADGDAVYEDLVNYFLQCIEETALNEEEAEREVVRAPQVASRRESEEIRRHYRPFEVAGMELEYAVVDRDLNAASLVEAAFREIAGRPTSDIELDGTGFSNEIADHVFELKTVAPTPSLATAEELLFEGVRRFSTVLRDRFDARLLPTGMHPWLDPREAQIWRRSGSRIYEAYSRIFDIKTHGWMNVHAAHLNLPLGREQEGVALHNTAALLLPYLPALAASSPIFAGQLQPVADGRLRWILEHQARVPESQGELIPEYVESFSDYRKRILAPMYEALDRITGGERLRHEFFNARGAVLRFSRKALEVRVVDTQECVKMDVAIAVFIRSALRQLSRRVLAGKLALPDHAVLIADFHATIRHGSAARIAAPHLKKTVARDSDGTASAQVVLRALLGEARKSVRKDEAPYLDIVESIIETGSLSERIRAALEPFADDSAVFSAELRRLYGELTECLERNEPWKGRGG